MTNRISALFFLCRLLAPGADSKQIYRLHRRISTEKVNWECVVSIANQHLMGPSLWTALVGKDLVSSLPSDVRQYFREIHRLNTRRNNNLKQQTEETVRILNSFSIEPILLKGSAYLAANSNGDLGARIMMDLDILVPLDGLDTSLNALFSAGYQARASEIKRFEGQPHFAPLFRSGSAGTIDLHTSLFPRDDAQVLTAKQVWQHAKTVSRAGLHFRILSPSHEMIYKIVHSEVTHEHFARGTIAVRELYDLAVKWSAHGEDLDWLHVRTVMKRHGMESLLQSFLFLGNRLFGSPFPPCIAPTPACGGHYLRCLLIHLADSRELGAILSNLPRAFSSEHLRRIYGCSNASWDLAKFRLLHFARLWRTYEPEFAERCLRWFR